MMVCVVVTTGCHKSNLGGVPEGSLRLISEGYSDQAAKAAVSGTSVNWVDGDEVYLNGTQYNVRVSNTQAYVDALQNATNTTLVDANPLYGFYNCGNPTCSTSTSVSIPSNYSCSYDSNGRQIIALPMAAYRTTTGTTIQFKNLTAALNVTVKNATNSDGLYIDKVEVVSATQNLFGNVTLDLTATDFGLAPSDGSNNTVSITFSSPVQINYNDTLVVQVPILPISSRANDLTVKVYAHNKANVVIGEGCAPADIDYTYNHTNASPALGRNALGNARVAISDGTNSTTKVDHGLFTVDANGTTVHFSQGNLQYIGSATTPYWKFADHQYDCYGSTPNTNTALINADRDLFGWGTSGWNNGNAFYQPYNTSNAESGSYTQSNGYGYGPTDGTTYTYSLTDSYANADWGVYNAISNGGNAANLWRTLTKNEWCYLLESRAGSTIGSISRVRFAKATVNSKTGIILFPDSVTITIPNGLSFNSSAYNNTTNGFTALCTNITLNQWSSLENQGAVFLPTAGFREGSSFPANSDLYGLYWSTTANGTSSAYHLSFSVSHFYFYSYRPRHNGFSVRLVRP